MSQRRLACHTFDCNQGLYLGQQSLVHTSTSLSRDLTEGTPSKEPPMSGFQKLKNNLTNLIVGGNQSGNDPKGDGNVDRQHSPEAHPFPDERAGSIYVQAQWQDDGVIHDVRPHGQGISLSSIGQAEAQAEKDVASA